MEKTKISERCSRKNGIFSYKLSSGRIFISIEQCKKPHKLSIYLYLQHDLLKYGQLHQNRKRSEFVVNSVEHWFKIY